MILILLISKRCEMTSRRDQEIEKLQNLKSLENDVFTTFGVLLNNEISYYAENYDMINPFKPKNLKSASYRLTVGEEYSIDGKNEKLSDEIGKNKISIKPFQVVIIYTAETINLPRFIIGRWNIQVRWAYEGLLWVGGPQVDPGWVGRLPCPIYNLSNHNVELELNETIAVMDFVKTTPFSKENGCIEYDRPNKEHVIFDDYNPEKLKSGIYEVATEKIEKNKIEQELQIKNIEKNLQDSNKNLRQEINKLEKTVHNLGSRLDLSTTIVIAAIAALLTALSVFVVDKNSSSSKGIEYALDSWTYILVIISVLCVFISIGMYVQIIGYLKTISSKTACNDGEPEETSSYNISNVFKNSIIQISATILLLLIIALVLFTDLTPYISMKWQLLSASSFLIVSILFGVLLSMKERSELTWSALTVKRLTIIQSTCFIVSVGFIFWILLLKLSFL